MHQAACVLTRRAVEVLWFSGWPQASGTTLTLANRTQRSWRTHSTSWTACGFQSAPSWGREATSSQSKQVCVCVCVTTDMAVIAGSRRQNGRTHTRVNRRRLADTWRPIWQWAIVSGTTVAQLCSRAPTLRLSKATVCGHAHAHASLTLDDQTPWRSASFVGCCKV